MYYNHNNFQLVSVVPANSDAFLKLSYQWLQETLQNLSQQNSILQVENYIYDNKQDNST